ncbi:MAG: hypothetical protein AAF950_03335 [Pseudomonadota bacterium]
MFLKLVPNPYEDGLPKRAVLYHPNETQTFAIDAEALHRDPHLLETFGWWKPFLIRILDTFAYAIILVGVFSAAKFAWWLFIPCTAATSAMLLLNRKTAGEMAKSAAEESSENLFYLHENKAIWLVPEPFRATAWDRAA